MYYLLRLLLCVILPLTSSLDLGRMIRNAQCQSSCLRNLTIDDKCWNVGKDKNRRCENCWQTCEFLNIDNNKIRLNFCNERILANCPSCEIACAFHRAHVDDQYEPTKLPAPENDEIIHMNKHDVTITMHKNLLGIWEKETHYTVNQKIEMKPGYWIIITNENGTIKHYSWEKWQPKLQSLKKNGPLYQATITWTDWQAQLEKQRKNINSPGDKIFLELQNKKSKITKSSFIVTWQEETGNGIMGNQVADSESAQISLPPGRYLVRIAINDGPGSYSIIVDTNDFQAKEHFFEKFYSFFSENKTNVEVLIFSSKIFVLMICGFLAIVTVLLLISRLQLIIIKVKLANIANELNEYENKMIKFYMTYLRKTKIESDKRSSTELTSYSESNESVQTNNDFSMNSSRNSYSSSSYVELNEQPWRDLNENSNRIHNANFENLLNENVRDANILIVPTNISNELNVSR